jgi:SagB-type dehydrogenase family enzyme
MNCKLFSALSLALLLSATAGAQEPVALPAPRTEGGKPLMQALMARASSREFSAKPLPAQMLSDLLWAGFGINRPKDGRRTAPSARNWQEIDLYVATADGLYLYDAKKNELQTIVSEDVRALAGMQGFVKSAPLNLVYVADYERMGGGSDAEKEPMAYADTGFIAQNVYLYCASEGLATVIRASVDKPALAKKIGLRPAQHITLSQTVGYPKE